MTARDVEIARVERAAESYRAQMDRIKRDIWERGGPQSAHEHDAAWNRLADQLGRTCAWLAVLLRKRGRPSDLDLAGAVERGMWP